MAEHGATYLRGGQAAFGTTRASRTSSHMLLVDIGSHSGDLGVLEQFNAGYY